jgi:hypothetical protein
MNADRFFVECLVELESRASWQSSEYSLLRAGAILRELLVDGLPVVHEVNRERHAPVVFRVRRPPAPAASEAAHWHLGSLDPDTQAGGGTIEDLSLDRFLQVPVMYFGLDRVTVGDVITLAANVRGGVHRGKAETRQHKLVEAYRLKVSLGDTPVELTALIPIASVVLKGLRPLREIASREMPAESPPEPDGRTLISATWSPGDELDDADRHYAAGDMRLQVSYGPRPIKPETSRSRRVDEQS